MPKAGDDRSQVGGGMGRPAGAIYALIAWSALCLKSAFTLVGITAIVALFRDLEVHNLELILIPLCFVFVVINVFGIESAGRVRVLVAAAAGSLLLLYVARAMSAVDVRHFQPFAPHGLEPVSSTAAFVLICYAGVSKVASVAEEVKNPRRNIPLGMIFALLIVCVLYTLVIFVTVAVLPDYRLNRSLAGISAASAGLMGEQGKVALGLAGILAFLAAGNWPIMAASRSPLTLAREERVPAFLSRIHPRFKPSHVAILVTAAAVAVTPFLPIDVLLKVATTVLILTYVFTCLSIIILRQSRVVNYRPQFRAPLYPWIQIPALAGFAFLLLKMGKEAMLTSLILAAGAVLIYWSYTRIRPARECA